MSYTTQQLQAMSFYEINKALASKYLPCEYLFNDELLTVDLISIETHLGCHGIPYDNAVKYGVFDYRKPNDIMPLAFERRIQIMPFEDNEKTEWIADQIFNDSPESAYSDKNPLRAIACLLLMMD